MSNKNILALINQMYKLSMQKVFSSEQIKIQKPTNKNKKAQTDKNNSKKTAYNEFIRYYKAFIFLSVYLSIKASPFQIEVVPFKENIHLFKVIYEMERDYKLYILLEGVSLLLIEGSVRISIYRIYQLRMKELSSFQRYLAKSLKNSVSLMWKSRLILNQRISISKRCALISAKSMTQIS